MRGGVAPAWCAEGRKFCALAVCSQTSWPREELNYGPALEHLLRRSVNRELTREVARHSPAAPRAQLEVFAICALREEPGGGCRHEACTEAEVLCACWRVAINPARRSR